jgi:iron(III) transport system substrate-binding protein
MKKQDKIMGYSFPRPLAGLAVAALSALLALPALAEELNVYSARKEALIKPLLDRYSEKTGVTVNLVTAKGDALLARLKNEGRNSPADVLITTDAGRLYRAQQAGVLRPIESAKLQQTVPTHLRSAEDQWFGLSVRARAIVYNKDRVDPAELSTYEDLADARWKGRICIRSSGNIYNQSLVAGMIATRGADQTDVWLGQFVRNFARPPQGGDRDQIRAVAAGQCDVALVNSYYLGGMVTSDEAAEREAAARVAIFWPNQAGRGTHINVSGAGVTAASNSPERAVELIEFLVRRESQRWYAEVNHEYPVRDDVEPSPLLASWGAFKADTLDMTELGRLNGAAVMAMDRAGWR